FFSSRRRHTRFSRDWSSDVCSSDLDNLNLPLFLRNQVLTPALFIECDRLAALLHHFLKHLEDFLIANSLGLAARSRLDISVLQGRHDEPNCRECLLVFCPHRFLEASVELAAQHSRPLLLQSSWNGPRSTPSRGWASECQIRLEPSRA